MNIFIDLFSGLGGASAAFDWSPNWVTIKIDNNEELIEHNRGLIIADIADVDGILAIIRTRIEWVRQFPSTIGKIVIWASPPCDQFSWARQNGDNPRRMGQTIDDFDMTLVDAARQIIDDLAPDFWIIENVKGAIPIFAYPIDVKGLGCTPTQQIGSVILWGHFPLISIEHRDTWDHRKLDAKGSRSLRPNYRAMIPLAISKGLLGAIEHQRTLTSFCANAEQDA